MDSNSVFWRKSCASPLDSIPFNLFEVLGLNFRRLDVLMQHWLCSLISIFGTYEVRTDNLRILSIWQFKQAMAIISRDALVIDSKELILMAICRRSDQGFFVVSRESDGNSRYYVISEKKIASVYLRQYKRISN